VRSGRHGAVRPRCAILPGVLSLLFVCMGNICRSPTAEGVMRQLLRDQGLADVVLVDSAGIGSWHIGDPPDERATAAAAGRGIELAGSARQVGPGDFERFDLILAADRGNLRDLHELAPPAARERIRLLREYDAAAEGDALDVPDPYFGGDDGFEHVLDLVDRACRGLLDELRASGRL
jgi:low molecular weight protein-tyrosine phosphatase